MVASLNDNLPCALQSLFGRPRFLKERVFR